VGPESAGAHPGPVCYRKGGLLAITDANLVLGRILPDFFPHIFGPTEDQPLDEAGARCADVLWPTLWCLQLAACSTRGIWTWRQLSWACCAGPLSRGLPLT
jgi:hypothetical protein